MVKSDDFGTGEEYRSYLISTLTCLQQQSPVLEQEDVFVPEEPPPQEQYLKQTTQSVVTQHQIPKQPMHDADEVLQYAKVSLLDDSPAPSLAQLGLQNHPDAERPNYYRRHQKIILLQHSTDSDNTMFDECFDVQECRRAICGPDQQLVFLFPDTSRTEIHDDITTMKFLIKYKVNVGPLPISVNEAPLDRLHAYIEAHMIRYCGSRLSRALLRSKILRLRNKYRYLVEGRGQQPNVPGQLRELMVDLLKMTWE